MHGFFSVNNSPVQGLGNIIQPDFLKHIYIVSRIAETDCRYVALGDKPDKMQVIVYDSAIRVLLVVHAMKTFKNRSVLVDISQGIECDFAELYPGVCEQHGLIEAEAFQKICGLGIYRTESARDSAHAHGSFEESIGDCRRDGVCIRMLMTGDVYWFFIHNDFFLY